MSEFEISQCDPSAVPAVWAQLGDDISRGLRHGQGDEATPKQLMAQVLCGDDIMWVIHRGDEYVACLVVSVLQSNIRKVFVEMLAGSEMDKWAEQVENLLRDYRDLVGAECIEASCRKGLARYLGRRGWKQKAIVMSL